MNVQHTFKDDQHARKQDTVNKTQWKQQTIETELQKLYMGELSDAVYKTIVYIHNSYVWKGP